MLHRKRGIIQLSILVFAALFCSILGADIASADDLTISITIPGSSTPSGGGSNNNVITSPVANVALSGLAYPGATLTFLRDGAVIGTSVAQGDGTFAREFIVNPGVATFAVWARNRDGLISPTVSIAFEVTDNSVSRIELLALSPTIAHEQVAADGSLTVYGSAFPQSVVRLFNNINTFAAPFTVTAQGDGSWKYALPHGTFNPQNFSYKANYQYERLGIISPFSETLELRLVTCLNSDFNGDREVNLTDLSVLLFYWGRAVPKTGPINECVDRNQDQIIDLKDFSILMYEWTLKYELTG